VLKSVITKRWNPEHRDYCTIKFVVWKHKFVHTARLLIPIANHNIKPVLSDVWRGVRVTVPSGGWNRNCSSCCLFLGLTPRGAVCCVAISECAIGPGPLSAAITVDPRLARKDLNWTTGKPGWPPIDKQNAECSWFHLTKENFHQSYEELRLLLCFVTLNKGENLWIERESGHVAVERVAVLLCIRKVQGSNFSLQPWYPALLQSLPTGTSSQVAIASFHMLFNLLFINHPTIPRFEVQLLRGR
jgi:hypothetical protein